MRRWRHLVLVLGFLACVTVAGARVGYLNVSDRDRLQSEGDARSIRYTAMPAHRGIIFDRRGEPLAVSTPVASITLDPSRFDPARLPELAAAAELDADALSERFERMSGREFMYVRRRVPAHIESAVRELDLGAVDFESAYRRYYPAGEVAAHVVGITNVKDEGQEGAELAFDNALQSEAGSQRVLRDLRGNIVEHLGVVDAPQYGQDLELAIDLRLQFFAYQELVNVRRQTGAQGASLVLVDVESGEILALANQPSYNPNMIDADSIKGMRNRAVTDTYEPGSTVKALTALAALESGLYSPSSVIDTAPGYMTVRGKLIEDPINRGEIDLTTVLEKSSQVGIAKIALNLDERAVFDTYARAGLGGIVGTGLPGEAAPWMSDAQLDNPIVRTTLAYGYGIAVSPVQLAQAYTTIARLGRRVPLTILKTDVSSADKLSQRVFDAERTATLLSMLEGVVSPTGTAPLAAVPGYRVAGKTGTVRKRSENGAGYDDTRHVAWFAGVAPASDPRLVLVVMVDEPSGDSVGGGTVAAPVFGKVMARALRLLSVPPDGPVQIASAGGVH